MSNLANLSTGLFFITDSFKIPLFKGFHKVDDIFHHEHVQNRLQSWFYRMTGWIAVFIGFNGI